MYRFFITLCKLLLALGKSDSISTRRLQTMPNAYSIWLLKRLSIQYSTTILGGAVVSFNGTFWTIHKRWCHALDSWLITTTLFMGVTTSHHIAVTIELLSQFISNLIHAFIRIILSWSASNLYESHLPNTILPCMPLFIALIPLWWKKLIHNLL